MERRVSMSDLYQTSADLRASVADLARQAGDLVEHDASTLRDDPIARANTASRADEICSLFSL